MNYKMHDIEQAPAMLTIRAEEYGLVFRCVAYPETGQHATFGIHVHALDEDGNIGREGDYLTRETPKNGYSRDELIESANEYIREMLEEE